MTVNQLAAVLRKAQKYGKGHWPVEIMVMQGGITMAQSITGTEVAKSYDGERVWLFPEREVQLPQWLTGAPKDTKTIVHVDCETCDKPAQYIGPDTMGHEFKCTHCGEQWVQQL